MNGSPYVGRWPRATAPLPHRSSRSRSRHALCMHHRRAGPGELHQWRHGASSLLRTPLLPAGLPLACSSAYCCPGGWRAWWAVGRNGFRRRGPRDCMYATTHATPRHDGPMVISFACFLFISSVKLAFSFYLLTGNLQCSIAAMECPDQASVEPHGARHLPACHAL